MLYVKELTSPQDVVDYVQAYLGTNPSAASFARFFVAKRSYLFNKMKQENAEVKIIIYFIFVCFINFQFMNRSEI